MPGRCGTGSLGAGPMAGRDFGFCAGVSPFRHGAGFGFGLGLGWRCGFGRSFLFDEMVPERQKKLLQSQKEWLQIYKAGLEKCLEAIDKQLEDL
ncbi:MAG TPA: DUF5320 domain-containing protein [Clostridia bacterium]|jgi:hypothetical protein|nr:DUF5320 domain-containing protein [Clostridia bacterium]